MKDKDKISLVIKTIEIMERRESFTTSLFLELLYFLRDRKNPDIFMDKLNHHLKYPSSALMFDLDKKKYVKSK